MKFFVSAFLLLQLVAIGYATPLVNGDFTSGPGSPGWRFVTPGSGSNVGGSINTVLGVATLSAPSPSVGFLGVNSIFGLRMQTQVNAAVNSVSAGAANILDNANALVGFVTLGRGSMIYQTFDALSGNTGRGLRYLYSASMNGTSRAFAYFFGIDTQEETLVVLDNGSDLTRSFNFGANDRMLVAFGVLGTGGSSNGVLSVQRVSQVAVPEIDAGTALIPLALMAIGLLVLSDRVRSVPGQV